MTFDAGASPQIEMTTVILIVSLVQAEEPIRSWAASTQSAHMDQHETRPFVGASSCPASNC